MTLSAILRRSFGAAAPLRRRAKSGGSQERSAGRASRRSVRGMREFSSNAWRPGRVLEEMDQPRAETLA